MSLIDCPECENEVSPTAFACSTCGLPLGSTEVNVAASLTFTNCPECGHEVSPLAFACPECGHSLDYDDAYAVLEDQVPPGPPVLTTPRWNWTRMVNFKSRTRRIEFYVATTIASVFGITAVQMVDSTNPGMIDVTLVVASLAVLMSITLAASVNRFHDMGRSGWLTLLYLIPFVNLAVLLWVCVAEGQPEPNRWGPPVA